MQKFSTKIKAFSPIIFSFTGLKYILLFTLSLNVTYKELLSISWFNMRDTAFGNGFYLNIDGTSCYT